MKRIISRALGAAAASVTILAGGAAALSEPRHGIAMYGEPALPPDFVSLPYVNPDAPKGGKIITGEVGSFDSLNPHIRKGRVPWQLRFLAYESLMGRSWDEPFTLYGLLAESIETGPNREWVEFTLRPEARFSDGSPVTVEDVMWSYETLGTIGHPRYHGAWQKVEKMEQTGPRSIRFTFNTADRELPLILGLRPILKKAQWEGRDFTQSGLDVIPISTAPYVITDFEAGRFVELSRDPDYWGRDLPFRRGTMNLDTIRMEFFADGTAQFEAFKAGILNSNREFNAAKWESDYDFPAIRSGQVVKSLIPHQRPSGITGFVMNTRRPLFADWRVREAMLHAFNFEYINQTQTGGAQPRITSYFSNSVLGMRPGPAEGRVRELLAPFADELLPGALEGYALPEGDGTQRNRRNLARADALLREAGWQVVDGRRVNAEGEPFAFEILLAQGSAENRAIAEIFAEALNRLGIEVTVTEVDSAQYRERTQSYDFDMTYYRRGLSLSPGNEQYLYWGCEGVEKPGTRNWMGMCSKAAEAMIERILNAESREEFIAATRALDRVLTTGRYVIPFYQFTVSRIAHDRRLKYPEKIPMYGDWIGWQPDVWWWEEE
ncbi:peptide/nickel transport system substrate-binding protein [Meinhardsimonia xiamenensis]|jgi:peptide/nickel transport system substrate-binding protein|uniref:Peptide/nickel transport system substrate-binding protein n=1 Tax=Meinhardsimonia xiamenensis TaxID=990712 RepID=A0A1G9GMW3_9RHOB|nr:extracellular solute-binding protein [Meinhardsimonia xiamenensis]PRX30536.1 peptide/nickel transport system substrate-binding protein [Meinhardsimonia xiamenensis]SDL01998.1 peptide/nickel transport system substrate-binding protein [Meinhardsimonia xiamenensis]